MVCRHDCVCFVLGDGRLVVRMLVRLGVEHRGGGWGYWGLVVAWKAWSLCRTYFVANALVKDRMEKRDGSVGLFLGRANVRFRVMSAKSPNQSSNRKE
jgi:hypothetical protein